MQSDWILISMILQKQFKVLKVIGITRKTQRLRHYFATLMFHFRNCILLGLKFRQTSIQHQLIKVTSMTEKPPSGYKRILTRSESTSAQIT
jgi:hypothetical protein